MEQGKQSLAGQAANPPVKHGSCPCCIRLALSPLPPPSTPSGTRRPVSVTAHGAGWLIIHAHPPSALLGMRLSKLPARSQRLHKVQVG